MKGKGEEPTSQPSVPGKRKLRLLLLTQYFHPEVGATQTRMREFAKHLTRLGHEATVVCEFPNHPHGIIPDEYRGKWFEKDRLDGFDVIRVWVKTSRVKNSRTRLMFYISYMIMAVLGGLKARGRFDVVFATSPPLFVAVSGWVLSVLRRTRFVMDVRDIWPEAAVALGELRNPHLIRVAEAVERFLYRSSAKITAVTKGFLEHIGPRCGDPGKLALLPNGTIPEVFHPADVDPDLRSKLGLAGKFVISFAGNMGIAQGMPFLLDLAKDLSHCDDVRFLFIGAGPVRGQLEEKQKREKIDNVAFLDQVPLTEITKYLTMSDVLLVPLNNDPVFKTFIPSKMFDFLACARPIVLGVDGEARALLEARGGGLYAEPENLESYRRALLTLRGDPELRLEMGKKGHAWVTADFTREAQARQLERVLLDCVESPRR